MIMDKEAVRRYFAAESLHVAAVFLQGQEFGVLTSEELAQKVAHLAVLIADATLEALGDTDD